MDSIESILISPIAYIKSLMYFQQFASEHVNEQDYKFACGLLMGYIDPYDHSLNIENFIPIKDFDKEYIKFEKYDGIFEDIIQLNKEYFDEEYPEYILGWARNDIYDNIEPNLIDKKNHLFFQSAINPHSIFWIFNHENLAVDDGYKIYHFKEDFKQTNITSELEESSYEYTKEVSIEEFMDLAIQIEEKRKNGEKLMKGMDEPETLVGLKLG